MGLTCVMRIKTESKLKTFSSKKEENKMETSLLMDIFNTCRLFSRYGTTTSPCILT